MPRKPKTEDQIDEAQVTALQAIIAEDPEHRWQIANLASRAGMGAVDVMRYLRLIHTRAGYLPTAPIPWLETPDAFAPIDYGEPTVIFGDGAPRKTDAFLDPEAAMRDKIQPQPTLPGIPPPRELWPRFDGYRVAEVEIGFPSGRIPVTDPIIASALMSGAKFSIVLQVEVVARDHHLVLDRGSNTRHMAGVAKTKVAEATYHAWDEPKAAFNPPAPTREVVIDGETGLVESVEKLDSETSLDDMLGLATAPAE